MRRTEPHLANADQTAYWNSEWGRCWIACQEALDQKMGPITEILMARAAIQEGDRIVDVGCGTGTTTLRLAGAVGAHGSVLAVDVSEPLLEVARGRLMQSGHGNVRLVLGDAQTHPFERASYDLVASRFGVMFFDDPVGAFRNLASALRPGGRLAFVCWAALEENPWFKLPVQVGIERLGPVEPGPRRAPGPLAFAEPDYVDEILSGAGCVDIRIDRVDTWLPGAGAAREDAELATQVGPLARMLRERDADPAMRELLIEDLTACLALYHTPGGMRVPARVNLVTAAAPE
jgi:SAM-dependent methyltransferase